VLEGDAFLSAVVTDVRLGTGPSGWDVAHRARELVPTIPVIYMTGDSASLWSVMVSRGALFSKSHLLRHSL
jgi:FixJ family two-component response regulator